MKKEHTDRKQRKLHTSTLVLFVTSFLVAVVALDLIYAYGWGEREKIREATASTDVFKTLDADLLEGGAFTVENLGDAKVTAFNVWETTCPACLGEMGALEELSKTYPASEFQLVGVCADVYDKDLVLKQEQVEKGKTLMQNAGVTFPNLVPTPEMYQFIRATVAGYPTTFFVDSKGNILQSTCGAKEADEWKRTAEEVMEGQK